MSIHDRCSVTIFGVDNTRWDVHGPLAGRQGVWIGEGQLSGILDAPLESAWSETAAGIGARHVRDRYKPRDLIVGFHVNGEGETVPGQREDALARALVPPPYIYSPTKRTGRAEVTTEMSGMRWIYFRGQEVPEIDTGRDFLADAYANPIYNLRAGFPLWESETIVRAFETENTSATGEIIVENPSDTPCRYTVILTPGDWLLPDPSWSGEIGEVAPGGPHATRTIAVSVTEEHSGAVLSRNPQKLPVATPAGHNLLSAQQGRFLVYDIPPWTPATALPIAVSNAPTGGARAEYHLTQHWTRPWGMSRTPSGG
ncbi:hypothetical protein [Gordonia sp. DT101]|uniref:hypothetical protein n=1 Tax=Gordonia sp. DT101 TaxID=3416545 RepID=UPI003CF7B2AF